MNVAILSSKRSKDPNTQVGACIVDDSNIIVGTGYNGFPNFNTCNADDILPWSNNSKDVLSTKYPYVIHAEANAILNSTKSTRSCSIYVTWMPCAECAKLIIQSGIKRVSYIYEHETEKFKDSVLAAKTMFNLANVEYIKYSDNIVVDI